MQPDTIAGRRPRLRVRDAAAYIGLTKSTLDKMRSEGRGPAYYKMLACVVYDPDDLDAWMKDFRRMPGPTTSNQTTV